ncbi:hypothetical protein AUG19_05935 [archaeon 13_1_20CM_2_54_9]|nr:MAG: hypothetical protein AUG19_05935 [archaeon 13_1_20CM_2_54_9]
MDWRLLGSALIVDATGIIVFLVVYPVARMQNTIAGIASAAEYAILVLAVSVGFGLCFMILGLARRRPLSYAQASVLAMGDFALGIFSLFESVGESIGYQNELATCGGFPAGYWTTGNATVNRCSIFGSVHQDWVSDIYGVVLASSIIAFCLLIYSRLRLARQQCGLAEDHPTLISAFGSLPET